MTTYDTWKTTDPHDDELGEVIDPEPFEPSPPLHEEPPLVPWPGAQVIGEEPQWRVCPHCQGFTRGTHFITEAPEGDDDVWVCGACGKRKLGPWVFA